MPGVRFNALAVGFCITIFEKEEEGRIKKGE